MDNIDYSSLVARLRPLLDPQSCIAGTPMVPLHQQTISKIVATIESLVAERDALRALLREIWAEVEDDEAYDALLDKIHAALKDATQKSNTRR